MKVHTALFEGRRGEESKNEALLFQSTTDIHIQNAAAMCSVATKLRRLARCAFININKQ